MGTSARHIGWIAGAGALVLTTPANASNPFAEQMDAVVRIGTEQIELRFDAGIEAIADARSRSLGVLIAAEELGVDDKTLGLAEFDARTTVRDAALLAHADLRGMAVNTLTTLENFGATQDQINAILTLWDEKSDALDEAIELAMDDVEETTPVSTQAVERGVVTIDAFSADLLADASHVFEAMALEMEAALRTETDDEVRHLRYEKTRSHAPKTMRSMMRTATRDAKRDAKTMCKTLKAQFQAFKQAMKDQGADGSDIRELKAIFKDADRVVRNAMDDAKADLKAAK